MDHYSASQNILFLIFSLQVLTGSIGSYTINFFSQGAYSNPLSFTAQHQKQNQMPAFSFNLAQPVTQSTNFTNVGFFLQQGKITLEYNNSGIMVPAVGFKVIAALNTNEAYDDLTDLGSKSDPMAVFNIFRVNFTDTNGLVCFDKLSVVDILGNQVENIHFQAFIGQSNQVNLNGFNASGNLTSKSLSFQSNRSFELSKRPYSTNISQGFPFPSPIKLSVTKSFYTDMDREGLAIYLAAPFKLGNYTIQNNYLTANFYLKNYLCIYWNQKSINEQCSSQYLPRGAGPYIFEFEFQMLSWIYSFKNTKFKLTFSDPLNYVKYIPSTLEPISTQFSAETQEIEVSSNVEIIEIIMQPQPLITVGDTFPVTVKTKVSSGVPVQRATVQAFITQSPFQNVKQTVSELKDLVLKLASGSVDAKSLGKLTQKANVELDKSTSLKKTNQNGELQFNLKIISGLPGNFTLTFQSGKVKSSRSVGFELVNRIQSITFDKPVENHLEVDLKYNKAYNLEFSSQPILKLNFLNNLPFLGEKVIKIKVYKFVDLQSINEELSNQTQKVIKSTEVLLDEYNSGNKQLLADIYSTMRNTWNAILNGGKIMKEVDANSENLKVSFSYPEEFANGTIAFKDISVEWKKYGVYMLVFEINGIESAPTDAIYVRQKSLSFKKLVLNNIN